MISAKQITEVFENATRDFRESPAYRDLVSGKATAKSVREFIGDIFRTHYLSSHIVALCFASLPSAAAALLKENLLEEMGRSEEEKPHSALLIKLAQGAGFSEKEIDGFVTAVAVELNFVQPVLPLWQLLHSSRIHWFYKLESFP